MFFGNLALLVLGLSHVFLSFPTPLRVLVRLVVGLEDEDVIGWRPIVLIRLFAVLDFLHQLVDQHVVELFIFDRDVVILEVLYLLAH